MNKCRKRILSLVLVVCLTAGLTGCTTYTNFKNAFFGTDPVAKEKTIKIGVFEPTSGSLKTQGKEEVMGIRAGARSLSDDLRQDRWSLCMRTTNPICMKRRRRFRS